MSLVAVVAGGGGKHGPGSVLYPGPLPAPQGQEVRAPRHRGPGAEEAGGHHGGALQDQYQNSEYSYFLCHGAYISGNIEHVARA